MAKEVLIVGTGLAGLATALRLSRQGYKVRMVEKYHQAGGRLNQLKKDGFTWDMAPSFFSMSYEFVDFARECKMQMPFEFVPLNPLYSVHLSSTGKTYRIYKDLNLLADEFAEVEPGFRQKIHNYMKSSGRLFHDTETKVVKQNFDSVLGYLLALSKVPMRHSPKMIRSFWSELERHFESEEVKEILSLVAFFLGGTPFDTPAVYTLLSYTELMHDGYFNVKGGMYKIVEGLVNELKQDGVEILYNTEIVDFKQNDKKLFALVDQNGKEYFADVFVVNSDAAFFRGKVFKRRAFQTAKLDKMKWTMAPLTVYLGVKGKVDKLQHHSYFLGDNFHQYARGVFQNSVSFDKPYYYVNAISKSNPSSAPDGCEALFILCPVPDLRFKPNWEDREKIVENILLDLSQRVDFDLIGNTISKTITDPSQWADTFNLYRGSGLGLSHNLGQMGIFRPKNRDELFNNVFYTGSSTVPGTGLPMAIISSKLTAQRISEKYGSF